MQSAPNLKEADPHDIFAIESVLAAHAQKSPPIAPESERMAPPIVPQSRAGASQAHTALPVQAAPPVFVGPPAPPSEPSFDIRDVPANDTGSAEIKLDGLGPLGPQPTSRWAKRLFIAGLGLVGAVTAAAWQHYGDEAKAMANEWVPHAVLAALAPAAKTTAEQPVAAAEPAVTTDQSAIPAAATPAAAEPPAVLTATPANPAPGSPESAQLQSMAQDLATMGQQVEELKATIAQLKASQAQMTRELAKSSEAKSSEAKASEARASEIRAPEPRVAAAPPPPVRPAAPPPVRKPKPPAHTSSSSYAPSYSPSPAPVAAAAPLALVQPPPPAPVRQTLADDGQPVVRPPMPLR